MNNFYERKSRRQTIIYCPNCIGSMRHDVAECSYVCVKCGSEKFRVTIKRVEKMQ